MQESFELAQSSTERVLRRRTLKVARKHNEQKQRWEETEETKEESSTAETKITGENED
ncbi:hypothetical protein OS493_039960 [Desmophyllum pertusum]|uniref:Uncharacterized protein n=1 Tax=Desmophyllum pertusum TaxID=174260 RepID=A0A9X0CCB9_9CNID|nr:hypothetical protein OS493_039960 [Desmophyllum pertusum]